MAEAHAYISPRSPPTTIKPHLRAHRTEDALQAGQNKSPRKSTCGLPAAPGAWLSGQGVSVPPPAPSHAPTWIPTRTRPTRLHDLIQRLLEPMPSTRDNHTPHLMSFRGEGSQPPDTATCPAWVTETWFSPPPLLTARGLLSSSSWKHACHLPGRRCARIRAEREAHTYLCPF